LKKIKTYDLKNAGVCSSTTGYIYSYLGARMAKAKKTEKPVIRHEVSGIERLGLRVSSMINHPVAQVQRWVTIHRLDTDGDREWREVMGLLTETDGIDMAVNDDESVTLKWEASAEEDRPVEVYDPVEEPAPF
jgi:hypothetical protein